MELEKTRIPKRFGFDAMQDIQVLCPMNRGGAGARSLNIELQAALNPAGERKVERFGWTFAPGDKVMQIENDHDKEVYNGGIGHVADVDSEDYARRSQNREIIRLVAELRRLRDQKDTVKRLSEEAYRLRFALDVSEAAQGRLKARLLRATEAVRSKSPPRDPAELRAALRRSRRQKTTIRSLSKENARLHRAVRRSGTRKEALEGRLAKLRATGKTLSGTVGEG